MSQTTITQSPADLEALVRRVVHDEITRLLQTPVRSILEDWKHEGPDDPKGDQALLSEALAVLEQYGNKPEAWTSWEEFERELQSGRAFLFDAAGRVIYWFFGNLRDTPKI